ncbi:MAG: class I SAM-dependent methyltransferase, partial [Bacteroidales bacterium]
FYANKIEKAYHLRQTLGLIRNDNTIFRLIYGEGDGLSGLIVDVYGSTAVMQAHSPGMHLDREIIASALIKVCGKDLQNVYYKSKSTLSSQTGLNPTDEYLIKDRKIVETKENLSIPDSKFAPNSKFAPTKNSSPLGDSLVEEDTEIAWENGLKVYPNWIHGQTTGFFIDQRDNRALVEKYAKGKNVLNMFCYTGGFSLYALRGGANKVHSVDSSSNAMALTDANVSLNFGKQDRHQSFTQEAFAFLDKAEATLNKVDYDYAEKMVKKPTIKEEDKEILVDRLYELNKVIKNKDQKANLEKENACVLASLTNLVEDAENVLNKEKLETAYEAINNYGLNREDIDPLLERLNIVEENINNNPNKYAESAEIVETYEVSKPDSLLVKLSVVIGDGI